MWHPDEFYDHVDTLERQGISELNLKIKQRCSSNKEIIQQINIYDDAIELEDENISSNLETSNTTNATTQDGMFNDNESVFSSFSAAQTATRDKKSQARRQNIATAEIWRTSIRKMKQKGLISEKFKFERDKTVKNVQDFAKHQAKNLNQKSEQNSSHVERKRQDRKTLAEREQEYRRLKAKEINKLALDNTKEHLVRKKQALARTSGFGG